MERTHATTTTRHHDQVRLQRRVHRTRRLLRQAADHLLDLDLAIRGDDLERAELARRQAADAAAEAQRQLDALDPDLQLVITLP